MNHGKLDVIPLDQIDFGDRKREDYGDMDELIDSIRAHGLIHPIAIQSDDGNPPYKLAAGGRRYLAFTVMKEESIPCRIYDHPLTESELKAIELLENIDRKDFTFLERCNLYRNIHNLMVEVHGKKLSKVSDDGGWSMHDTAKFLGKAIGTVSEDIKLAEMNSALPSLELEKCKTKQEAKKSVERLEKTITISDIVERTKDQLLDTQQKLADAYVVGDFFDEVKKIPDGSIDLVEIDPPYGIKLESVKKLEGTSYDATYGETYNEVNPDQYNGFMNLVLKESYRIMNTAAWLIMWFGPEPWFESMYQWIIANGFKCRRMPAIWIKGIQTGQCMQPGIYLGASYEMFFYARKNDAKIMTQGRKSQFDFEPVTPSNKIHPTERPIPLLEEILRTFTHPGAKVVVPFAGSGNTLRAAANLGMIPWGCDLEQEYKNAYVGRIIGG